MPEEPQSREYMDDDVRAAVLIIMGFSLVALLLGTLYFSLHPITPTPGL